MKILTRDTWIGVVMLIVAVVYWFEANKIRVSPLDDGVGAAGLPKALAYALGALAIILILRSLAGTAFRNAPAPDTAKTSLSENMKPHFRAAGMLAIGVGYLLLVSWLGYVISLTLLLLCVSLYFGAPLNTRTLVVAGVGGVVYHLLFVEFLDIPLPVGAIIGSLLNG